MKLPKEILSELESANAAINGANMGKARVCARRAVGAAYLLSITSPVAKQSLSAIQILRIIGELEKLPDEVKSAAKRLSASVSMGEISSDPIGDAQIIIGELLRNA